MDRKVKMETLIKEINRLAKIAKERELTNEELLLRDKYRKEYINIFKGNMRKELDAIKIVDEFHVSKNIDIVKEKLLNVKGIIDISISGLKTKISYEERIIRKEDIEKLLEEK